MTKKKPSVSVGIETLQVTLLGDDTDEDYACCHCGDGARIAIKHKLFLCPPCAESLYVSLGDAINEV